MAAGITNTSVLAPLPQAMYDRNMRERALPLLLHGLWAQRKPLPQNQGNQVIFTRFESLPKGTLLAEGVNPEPQLLQRTQVTAQIATYGAYTQITDEVETQSPDKVLLEASDLLGESAGETIDEVYRDELHATSSVYYGGSLAVATVDTPVEVNVPPVAAELDAIILALQDNNAKYITEMVDASTGVGTESINPAFIGITSPRGGKLISNLTGFTKAKDYANTQSLIPGEIGTYDFIRVCVTTQAQVLTGAGAGAKNIHTLLVLAKNAYGIVELSGKALENIVHDKSDGTGGPLNMYGTSGWKAMTTAKVLNDNFMYRYLFTLT